MRASLIAGMFALSLSAFGGIATHLPAAGALVLPPGGVVHAPHYCEIIYGDPAPCPPPDHPTPVDPGCLRVEVEPLRCPYQP